jgi:hypothetical protein
MNGNERSSGNIEKEITAACDHRLSLQRCAIGVFDTTAKIYLGVLLSAQKLTLGGRQHFSYNPITCTCDLVASRMSARRDLVIKGASASLPLH